MPRVLFDHDPLPLPEKFNYSYWQKSSWIGPEQVPVDVGFWAFRRQVEMPAAGRVRVHVSADQRYVLYLNGQRLGRGPERGDLRHWMFESYDLDLPAGRSTLVAVVWWQSLTGKTPPPWAQMTQRPGFWLQGEGPAEVWNTGSADWEMKAIDGIGIETDQMVHFHHAVVGPRVRIDAAAYPWGIERGDGDAWMPAPAIQPATSSRDTGDSLPYWLLRPAMLPPMREAPVDRWRVRHVDMPPERTTVNFLVRQENHLGEIASLAHSTEVPTRSRRRYIIDLEKYHCAFHKLVVSGGCGAYVRLRWAESLYKPSGKTVVSAWYVKDKADRDEIEGRHYLGTGDTFIADGGRSRVFEPLWWNAGRYIELFVETADEPLMIDSFELISTGYPYEFTSTFAASDERLKGIEDRSLRTLQMCSHETSMDCPYYEQLNYAGDTRLQSLIAMTTSRDDRLVRKSLRLFDWSRTGDTWAASRYPSNTAQTIPTFCMWWVCMAYDYALWRGDLAFVKSIMPGVRSIVERWREQIGTDGLVRQPAGWNFVDWVKSPDWVSGIPNPAFGSPCGIIQWQLVYTLGKAAELEEWLNEPLMAQRHRQTGSMLAATAERAYWNAERNLFATDLEHTKFAEHSAVLALLGGQLSANLRDQALNALVDRDLPIDRSTIYFSHYLFEALAQEGRADLIPSQLGLWFDHEKRGMSTLLESPEPSRSDCHAWAAHPLYHFYTSILGIRPAAAGFARVRIRPQLGPLGWVKGRMVHPLGEIVADVRQIDGRLTGHVEIPNGLTGELVLQGETRQIGAGRTPF